MAYGFQVTFDALDPQGLADFWAIALGYESQPPPDGYATWEEFADAAGIPAEARDKYAALVDPAGSGPRVLFQRVPEGKSAKNRVHLDVNAGGPRGTPDAERHRAVEAHVEVLAAAGAEFVARFDQPDGYWVVMRDPEGNEFCVQ